VEVSNVEYKGRHFIVYQTDGVYCVDVMEDEEWVATEADDELETVMEYGAGWMAEGADGE
jgi:hypothetical protein